MTLTFKSRKGVRLQHGTILICRLHFQFCFTQKPFESADRESLLEGSCASTLHIGAFHLDLGTPADDKSAEKAIAKPLDSLEQEEPLRNKDLQEKEQENGKQPFLPQYLYLQPAAGKDCNHI